MSKKHSAIMYEINRLYASGEIDYKQMKAMKDSEYKRLYESCKAETFTEDDAIKLYIATAEH